MNLSDTAKKHISKITIDSFSVKTDNLNDAITKKILNNIFKKFDVTSDVVAFDESIELEIKRLRTESDLDYSYDNLAYIHEKYETLKVFLTDKTSVHEIDIRNTKDIRDLVEKYYSLRTECRMRGHTSSIGDKYHERDKYLSSVSNHKGYSTMTPFTITIVKKGRHNQRYNSRISFIFDESVNEGIFKRIEFCGHANYIDTILSV